MNARPSSPDSLKTHFVDIHEVLHEDEKEEGEESSSKIIMADNDRAAAKRFNKQMKLREGRRSSRGFSRQVSLETGFSVLNGESSKHRNDRKVLSRSGQSFSGFGVGAEGRKGDFSIFKTKSNLVRQNSKLPLKKESGIDHQKSNLNGELDDGVNESVPAGRYFDALRGPELDQVKVLYPKLSTYHKVL